MDLSIVLPALNEAGKIAEDVKAAADFLDRSEFSGEVIVVDDGSTDSTARDARETEIPPGVKLHVIRYENNRGKGHAVQAGINHSTGDYVMFADSGLCVPFDNALRGIEMIRRGECDIAHGSRVLRYGQFGQPKPLTRLVLSAALRLGLVLFVGLPEGITDTQCGFKVYRGNAARSLYAELSTEGFGFDVEILLRAVKRGYTIREFPVDWTSDLDTRIRVGKHAFSILGDLFKMRRIIAAEKEGEE